MAGYLGDFLRGATVPCWWNSANSLGAAANPSSNGTVFVCKSGSSSSNTQVGVTLTTGIFLGTHAITVNMGSTTNFFQPENDYSIILSAFTVDGQLVSGCVGQFSVENRYETGLILRSTLSGGAAQSVTLGATASGVTDYYAGAFVMTSDFTAKQIGRVGTAYAGATKVLTVDRAYPSTDTPAAGTTVRLYAGSNPATIAEIQNGLPTLANLNSGVTVTSLAANVVTATAIAANAITAAKIATGSLDSTKATTDYFQEGADRTLRRNVAGGSDSGRSVSEALFVLRNKVDATGSIGTVYQTNDVTSAFTFSTNTGAFPFSLIDPA